MTGSLTDRFWEKVKKTDGCWVWTRLPKKRYGALKVRGREMQAHRVSWEIHFGAIPEGLCVLHACDNTKCVRPDHLFLGTQADNVADMMVKGRNNQPRGARNGKHTKPECTPRGERHGSAKITRATAIAILNSYERQKDIARQFGVSQQLVSAIKTGAVWKELHSC